MTLFCNLLPVLHQLLQMLGCWPCCGVVPGQGASQDAPEQETAEKRRADFPSLN